ncbi:MAG: hypothetical protein H5T63_08245 [Chloroflexi bacterium]|nr:hypothetical protein [Chloroflexota bacterium]
MSQPRLTFFCELEADRLQVLFADESVIDGLRAVEGRVSLGILDLSAERAAVVRLLNENRIPVTAWQLLPKEQGYWFNVDNAPQAAARYQEFKKWTAKHRLRWDGVGLDIEPDIREMRQLALDRRSLLPVLLKRGLDTERLRRAQMQYQTLVAQIRADGYRVDSYQMPFIVDERQAGSTLLQRLAGLVDIVVDREVLMLYSSLFRPYGPGLLWSYAPDAQSVGLGVTGGGVEIEGVTTSPPMDWDEFSRDLLLAHHWTDDIHIFSLEGCVQQGFLAKLADFDWAQPVLPPVKSAAQVKRMRQALRSALWASAHPWLVTMALLSVMWMLGGGTRGRTRRKA